MKTTSKNWVLVLGLALALLISINSYGQNNLGVGLRFGDPTGITLKKYMGKNALEFNLGRSYGWYGRGRYYTNHFNTWYSNKKYAYADYQYLGYNTPLPLTLQGHYLWHNNFNKIGNGKLNGLTWYFGTGAQFRYRTFYYEYRYKVSGDPNWYYVDRERVSDIDLGIDGVIGFEYTFKQVPLSVFLDMNLFMELVNEPFWFDVQGGTGLRYNF